MTDHRQRNEPPQVDDDRTAETSELDELYGDIVDSWLERLRRGETAKIDDYVRQYPQFADEIRQNVPTMLMLEGVKHDTPEATPNSAVETVMIPGARKSLGDYRLLREIGRGGMGIVYQAVQQSLDRLVALKILAPHLLANEKHLARFQREAQAAAKLHHTNIVPVLDVGEDQGIHYFVMQYIEGEGLDRTIAKLRIAQEDAGGKYPNTAWPKVAPLSSEESASGRSRGESTGSDTSRETWRRVARLGIAAADALAHAHSHGTLHRDVKPSNFLLATDGTLWVSDFGLAKSHDDESVTETGDLVGTLRYLAPESFRGQFDERSDIHGLGLTLYELCALEPARSASNRPQLIRQVTEGTAPRLRSRCPGVPHDLETIIHKAIDPNPDRRYRSATQLSEDLGRFLADRPIHARRVGPLEHTWRWARRNPSVSAAIIAVLLIFGIALGLVNEARIDATRAAQRESAARAEAQRNAEQDRRNFRWAKNAVDQYLRAVADDPQLTAQALEPLRLRLLESARLFYDEFAASRALDPALQLDRAQAYFQLAEIADEIGSKSRALNSLEQGRDIIRQARSKGADATECDRALVENLTVAGKTHFKLGQFTPAESHYRQALTLQRRLHSYLPNDQHQGRILADLLGKLAIISLFEGPGEQAKELLDEAISLLDHLVAAHPDEPKNLEELASTLSKLSAMHARAKQTAFAAAAQTKAVAIRQRLASDFPENPKYREKLAAGMLNLGLATNAAGQAQQGLQIIETASEALRQLTEKHPSVEIYLVHLANAHLSLARIHQKIGQVDKAQSAYLRAITLRRQLTDRYPRATIHATMLGKTRDELAALQEQQPNATVSEK